MGMDYFKKESRTIGSTSSLDFGMDIRKVDTFAKDIGFNVKAIRNKIKDVKDLQTALDKAWQGAARDAFLEDLDESVQNLDDAVIKEYYDFMSRLQELADNMYKQDKTMYKQ